MPWHDVFRRLTEYTRGRSCIPPSPPTPLILAGWAYSNDVEKMRRWIETVDWATSNGCPDLVEVPDEDFYCVEEPTSYAVGPLGGPMYRPWDFEGKDYPQAGEFAEHLDALRSRWRNIVGPELALVSQPLAFTGAKARRLLVRTDEDARPPWGSWSHLSAVESERRSFTRFRASINNAIAPHEVDHVDFTTEGNAEQGDAPDGASRRR